MATTGAARRFDRQIRFLQARLSPEGYLGLHLTIGMVLILVTGWCFSEIAEDYSGTGWLAAMDLNAANASARCVTPTLTATMRAVSFLGSVGFVAAASCFISLLLALKRRWNQLLLFASAMGGGSLLNIVLKHFFHRQRPVLENPFVTLASYGFPSGHTMGSTLLWGCLAIFAATAVVSWRRRVFIAITAALWVATVGISRIYLGAHYFTDVIGACCAGLAWLTFCWTAVETLRRWRARHTLRLARQEASS